jgi:hypothetical protein
MLAQEAGVFTAAALERANMDHQGTPGMIAHPRRSYALLGGLLAAALRLGHLLSLRLRDRLDRRLLGLYFLGQARVARS